MLDLSIAWAYYKPLADSCEHLNQHIFMMYHTIAHQVLAIAQEAGKRILAIGYNSPVMYKSDRSPVTAADAEANAYIVAALRALTPDIPVIAEENTAEENQLIDGTPQFWLVDPLDGTRGFIRGESEYTVNIALIENNQPIGGVIYAPVGDRSYFTADQNAYKQIGNICQVIHARPIPSDGITVIASSSHYDQQTREFMDKLDDVRHVTHCPSSIKFCHIAEGSADLYPRFGKTMEWDTAAGHAIILAAGGGVTTPEGDSLRYRKKDFINPPFIVTGGR